MKNFKIFWTFILTLITINIHGQKDTSLITKNEKSRSNYTNEFFLSAGYNYCRNNFFDAGVRYYHWKNDGQTFMAFAGYSAGCEFSFGQKDQLFIPYIGWQGQKFMLAYGVRTECVIGKEKQMFGFTPELGLSLFEMVRITGGYRFRFDKNDMLGFNNFRFSLIVAFPLSFLKNDD